MQHFDPDKTTHFQRALKMDRVPPEKWSAIAKRTATGSIFLGLGLFGAAAGWSVWAVVGLAGYGAHIMSREVMNRSLREIVPLIKAVADVVRDKK